MITIRKIGVALGLVAALTVVPSVMAEGKKPTGGCAAAFELLTIDKILEFAAEGFGREAFEATDANNDDLLCVRKLENNPLFEPVTFLFFDNNKRLHE